MVLFSFFTLCFFIDFFSILHEKSDNQKKLHKQRDNHSFKKRQTKTNSKINLKIHDTQVNFIWMWTHATHAKILTHVKHAKILWTHATHAKIWLKPPMPPTLFSRIAFKEVE